MSEAVFRLYQDHKRDGIIDFSPYSWPKRRNHDIDPPPFEIQPVHLAQRMDTLLKALWRAQFIFLETLWEEYLQDLVQELRLKDAAVFEPFCEQKFMAGIVRDVLSGKLQSITEIKDESAARFAAGLTRQSWEEQWAQMSRLEIGLTKKDAEHPWFKSLDEYFEMRNCIIHRQGRVSSLLHQKTDYYRSGGFDVIDIWPSQLDFFRRRFIECVMHIEAKIEAKMRQTQ